MRTDAAAILLGRVDLRVDRKQFINNIKIYDFLSAVSHGSLSRIGTGRHGGRPSQGTEKKGQTLKLNISLTGVQERYDTRTYQIPD